MEFELSEDQELFRSTTRRFLEAESPLTTVRALADTAAGFEQDWWRQGAELGWTSMLVAEVDGGGSVSGTGLRDLALVAEEMGRLVAPGPLVSTNVVAGAVSRAGTEELRSAVLPGLLSGDRIAAWGPVDAGAPFSVHPDRTRAERTDDGFVLSGTKGPVEAGVEADHLLIAAMTDDGPTQFLVGATDPGVTVVPLGSIDLVRRFAEIHLDGVRVAPSHVVGPAGGAGPQLEWQWQVAVALQCAETCGVLQEVLDTTVEYLGDRYSFGRPLSSYQALKHRLADMTMWLQACHGTTTAALRAVGSDEAAETISVAKSYVGAHATEIIQDCVQLHGGIAVTWEHDIHLYLRRATLNRAMYGTPDDHLERLAVLLGMDAA